MASVPTIEDSSIGSWRPSLPDRAPLPQLAPGVVDRPVLRKRLDHAIETPGEHPTVITVTGPAGAGKTTFLTSWSRSRWSVDGTPGRWLELSDTHNDVVHLLRDLDGLLPDDPRTGAGRARATSTLVVIDRVEVLTSASSLALLEAVVRRSDPSLTLVLSGRRHAVPGLSRAFLDHSLVEIGPADLDLAPDEARRMLLRSGHVVSPDEEAVILARAEGWAAGLRFEMRRRLRPDYQADGEAVIDPLLQDYMTREVLDGLPPEALDLLLCLSVVDEVPVHLARVLAGRRDAGTLLRSLDHSHRLVRSVHGGMPAEARYRLHPMLRECLSARFQESDPGGFDACVRRAREWGVSDLNARTATSRAPVAVVSEARAPHLPGTDELRAAMAWHRWAILDIDEAANESASLAEDVRHGDAPAGVALAALCLTSLVPPSGTGPDAAQLAGLLPTWRARAMTSDPVLLSVVAPAVHRAALEHGLLTLRDEVLRTVRGRLPGADEVSVMEAVEHAAHRHAAEAARWLAAVDLSPGGTDPLTILRGRLLQAVLAARHGDRAAAHTAVSRALVTADRTRILLPFLEHRLEVAAILADGLGRFGRLNPLAEQVRGIAAPTAAEDGLTVREAQVLTELASLRTVPEMAEAMGVSENTIKTHLRNVYRKLGTSSRRQTLMAARHSGLL